jgi:hypothetical protein
VGEVIKKDPLNLLFGNTAASNSPPKVKQEQLQQQLLNLCTRDGTPDQARDAIKVMAALVQKGDKEHEEKAFAPLLKDLKQSITDLNIKFDTKIDEDRMKKGMECFTERSCFDV